MHIRDVMNRTGTCVYTHNILIMRSPQSRNQDVANCVDVLARACLCVQLLGAWYCGYVRCCSSSVGSVGSIGVCICFRTRKYIIYEQLLLRSVVVDLRSFAL